MALAGTALSFGPKGSVALPVYRTVQVSPFGRPVTRDRPHQGGLPGLPRTVDQYDAGVGKGFGDGGGRASGHVRGVRHGPILA